MATQPMSEARRQQVHGKLQSMIDDRPKGEPHPIIGVAFLCLMLAMLFGGLAFLDPAERPADRVVVGGVR